MSMKPACDVFGVTQDVKQYRVIVSEVVTSEDDTEQTMVERLDKDVDLCPKALKRLMTFIDRGTTSSKRKEVSE